MRASSSSSEIARASTSRSDRLSKLRTGHLRVADRIRTVCTGRAGGGVMGATWLVPLALLGGAAVAVQAGMNGRLGKSVGGPVMVGLLTTMVAIVAMTVFVAALRTPFPSRTDL